MWPEVPPPDGFFVSSLLPPDIMEKTKDAEGDDNRMELNIASRTVTDAEGKARRFRYALIVDQISWGNFACEDYGVCIREDEGECRAIPSITTSAMRIDELMTLLVERQVGPAGLADAVSDWL